MPQLSCMAVIHISLSTHYSKEHRQNPVVYGVEGVRNELGINGLSLPLVDLLQSGQYTTFDPAKQAVLRYLTGKGFSEKQIEVNNIG